MRITFDNVELAAYMIIFTGIVVVSVFLAFVFPSLMIRNADNLLDTVLGWIFAVFMPCCWIIGANKVRKLLCK